MVKYDADWEITNIYENLKIVWSQFFTDMLLFVYIQSTSNVIGLSVFRFIAKEYKWIAIQLLLTIRNIQSVIGWVITKGILNYSPLPISYCIRAPCHNLNSQFWSNVFWAKARVAKRRGRQQNLKLYPPFQFHSISWGKAFSLFWFQCFFFHRHLKHLVQTRGNNLSDL
jgi:hypothetical protein